MHIQLIYMKPSSLNDNIIAVCTEFSHRFTLALGRKFEEGGINITPEQFGILVVLLYKDGLTQKEISENLNRDKTTIARVVHNMKTKGIVKQVTDGRDNRARLIYLTQKGRTLQQAALNISGVLYMQAIGGIDEKYITAGIKLLQQMLTKF